MYSQGEPLVPTTAPTTAPVSEEQRIREGLKFLSQADTAVIKAAGHLLILQGKAKPRTPDQLLERFSFRVNGRGYSGKMTRQQRDYLSRHTGDEEEFADAIAKILVNCNALVRHAVRDLDKALDKPRKGHREGVLDKVKVGCCTFDNNQQEENVTQSFCKGGLQGQWQEGPCVTVIVE
jgi:hypothetical protein